MASLNDVAQFIDSTQAEQITKICNQIGNQVIEIKMKNEPVWASVTGTEPGDWALNYTLPKNAPNICQDNGQQNPACGMNAHPTNFVKMLTTKVVTC